MREKERKKMESKGIEREIEGDKWKWEWGSKREGEGGRERD